MQGCTDFEFYRLNNSRKSNKHSNNQQMYTAGHKNVAVNIWLWLSVITIYFLIIFYWMLPQPVNFPHYFLVKEEKYTVAVIHKKWQSLSDYNSARILNDLNNFCTAATMN